MDNLATEPTSLEGDSITDAFIALDTPEVELSEEEQLAEKVKALQADESEVVTDEEVDTQEPALITVEVDGKMVELTPEQVAEAYKSGLRQSDYSRKTAELAQERNTAQEQAKQERDAYAQKLNNYAIQLEGALNEQSQTNWMELLENDPVEYNRQRYLLEQRQTAYQNALAERQQIEQLQQQEQQETYKAFIQSENQKLLEALPAWKDEAKAKAEQAEIKGFLKELNFTDNDIASITDHRHVLLIKDALKFRNLVKQAPAATKKVALAPVRVERPGVAENAANNDARKAIERFKRSGSDKDVEAAFASLL